MQRRRDSLRQAGKSLGAFPPPKGSPQIRRKGLTDRKVHLIYRREDVSPFTGRRFQYWDIVPQETSKLYPLGKRHLVPYMAYLAERGYTLQVVDMETGEIVETATKDMRVVYRMVPLRPIYQQAPTTRILRDADVERISVLEQRLTLHEVEHIIQGEVPDDSRRW